MKPIILCLVLISAGLITAAQDPSDWKRYSSVEGQFSVLLPQSPEVHSLPLTDSRGITIPTKMFLAFGGDIEDSTFGIIYSDYTFDLSSYPIDLQEKALDAARDGGLKRSKATLVREEKISLSGNTGREVEAAGELGTILFRIFVVGHRLYFVSYACPKKADRAPAIKNAARFLDSFELNTTKN